jgi:hypothetical protein
MAAPMTPDCRLTPDEALALLPEGETVHAIIQCGPLLTGADWDRADVEDLLRTSKVRNRTGPDAQRVGHGLSAWMERGADGFWVFFETTHAKGGGR